MGKVFFVEGKIMKKLLGEPDRRTRQGLRDRCILLLLSLGLRRGEVCGLNVSDFNPQSGHIEVKTLKRGKNRTLKLAPEIVFKSLPCLNRWVAHEWRRLCGVM